METRTASITNHPYPEFDFDDASIQWRANKRHLSNGCYEYICFGITKKGKPCTKSALKHEDYCKIHCKTNVHNHT